MSSELRQLAARFMGQRVSEAPHGYAEIRRAVEEVASAMERTTLQVLRDELAAFNESEQLRLEELYTKSYQDHTLLSEFVSPNRQAASWTICKRYPDDQSISSDLLTHVTVTHPYPTITLSGDAADTVVRVQYFKSAWGKLCAWGGSRESLGAALYALMSRSAINNMKGYSPSAALEAVIDWYLDEQIEEDAFEELLEEVHLSSPDENLEAVWPTFAAVLDRHDVSDYHEMLPGFGLVPNSNALHSIAALRACFREVWKHHGRRTPPWASPMAWMPSPWA